MVDPAQHGLILGGSAPSPFDGLYATCSSL
jgi:hypothetical protein